VTKRRDRAKRFHQGDNKITRQISRKERIWICIFFTCFQLDQAEGIEEITKGQNDVTAGTSPTIHQQEKQGV
jgi:hypothetical protein